MALVFKLLEIKSWQRSPSSFAPFDFISKSLKTSAIYITTPGNLVLSATSFAGNVTDVCDDYIHCGLTIKSESSMSAPNVAGAAALISQYFKSGNWSDSVDILFYSIYYYLNCY